MPKHPPRHTPLHTAAARIFAAPLLLLLVATFSLSPAVAGASSSKALSPTILGERLIHRDFPKTAWPMAVHVATCESHFDATADHTDSDGTHDLGIFQLNTGGTAQELLGLTKHPVTDLSLAFRPAWNVQAAALLYSRDGWSRWSCAT